MDPLVRPEATDTAAGVPGPTVAAPDQAYALVLARERRRVLAHLTRRLGLAQLALAEDAVQVAALRAWQHWPREGLPALPGAWLRRVAWHAAVDQLRRQAHEVAWNPQDEFENPADAAQPPQSAAAAEAAPQRFATELDDDELALLFAACHPSLPPATQVALALRALTDLDLATLAEGLLSTEAALAQRLARARQALAGVALELPAGAALAPRREAVLTALSLLFHAGMRASGRGGVSDQDGRERAGSDAGPATALALCWEAIRLARALAAHPAATHADAHALAATLLLHGARLTGRLDAEGDIVPLPGQPRDRWDGGMVRLGLAHLQEARRAQRLSRWHLLAGIAAEHALASDYAATDWAAIVRYYEWLLALDPSAAPRLGHAIALAEAGAPTQARQRLLALLPEVPAALRAHALAALARALEREGERAAAREQLRLAIAAASHPADARLLTRRMQDLGP